MCCGNPAWDHAGIATQLVVERQLAERQQSRIAMGREKFLEAVLDLESGVGRGDLRTASPAGASPTGRASASPWTRGCRGRF